jgi:hypothetical protein
MAYLHCHACGWSQDDFWSKGYNPITSVKDYEQYLFLNPNTTGMDNWWLKENGYPETNEIKGTELVAHELERAARRVRNMVYRTEQEFREKNPERNCPKCGKHELDID